MHTIVITDADYESLEPEFDEARSAGVQLEVRSCRTEDDVIRAGQSADALIVQYAPITARVLDALPNVRAIGRYGVGLDMIDLEAAAARGVQVRGVPDYGVEEVSDHAIALTLATVRGIAQLDRAMRLGEYDVTAVKPLYRIQGRTFVVLGLGRIGAATARKALGLGYHVRAHDPNISSSTLQGPLAGIELVSFDEAIESAHVLSLHLPLSADTAHLIDAAVLKRMRSDSVLVNTCRGGVVDTDALVTALSDRTIAGAGIDVFEEEPVPAAHPLLALDNVVLTPHAAWYSEQSFETLKRRTVQNTISALREVLQEEVTA
ncbi:dehydrogenase [Leucobacter sp. UCD-THU]|uniref:C-terminal binding protein n=1 Tax=Leucobacter sp. UCD-THU TaxID=1292023 RepID=UPI00035C5B3A|nr:C-terminal binding protein [Leucobacter sp. UCD-THU]EYT56596.1 dehydrogenase [Leucobacter sp. UCD-THU]